MVKINKRLFAWSVALMLTLSSFAAPIGGSGIAYAKENNKTSYRQESKEDIEKKISPELKKEFAAKSQTTFLVKLKDQVDTEKVAKETKEKNKKLSSMKKELAVRSSIVSELKIKADSSQKDLKKYIESEKSKGKVKGYSSFYIVNGMEITATEDVMKNIAAMPEVESVRPNGVTKIIEPKKTPQSAVPAANNIEWGLEKIGAPDVWGFGIDGTGIVVANIDTGVQWDHPALKTKYRGYDPANPNSPNNEFNWLDATAATNSAPYDDHGHGTHTMGTMVGSEANGTNKIGVAPGAKWIAVKAFTADGGTDADLIEAGEWILAPKDRNGVAHPEMAPDVVNNSWGGGPGVDDWYRTIVRNWRAAGIFPEFSAGNTTWTNPGGPGSVACPANYPESFATGATDINDMIANFSLRGPSPYGGILKPEISAPGVNIRSSVPGSGYEGGWNGTSMAGPHTSGLVALMLQANSSLSIEDIERIIKETATPRTDAQYPEAPNNGYGHGIINALAAVSSVIDGVGEIKGQVLKDGQDTVPPTFNHTPVSEVFAGMEQAITVDIQDDISIKTVELQYRSSLEDEWTTASASRKSGDYKAGSYGASIPANKVAAPNLYYRWRIVDFGNNEVVSDMFTVLVKAGITVGYFNDFETEITGWESSGTHKWQWGTPTTGPNAAASGEKVIATNLAGTYEKSADMTMKMPPIDLPEGNVYLQFKHWYETENRYDKAYLKVSTDNKNWTTLATYMNASTGYADAEVNLSEYAGKRIYVAFNFTSDSSINRQGWFIDDVRLTNQSAASEDTPSLTRSQKKQATASVETTPEMTGLPLSATVSVVENGRSVQTSPADGSYSIKVQPGEYTLRAEAYGYHSQDKKVQVGADEVVDNASFKMEPLSKGTLTGKITNAQTGNPIENATIYLIEDAAVAPVKTDAEGNYSITAFEGTYTVQVVAGDYHGERFTVDIPGNGEASHDVKLNPFIGYPGEIGYDDGTAENAMAFYQAGNGYAVKMSLPEGKTSAIVTAGLFKFWDPVWPNPGGNTFKVAVFDASGDNGAPGRMIAGPFDATAIRNKAEWTVVDLSDKGIVVTGDYYMVYIQDKDNPNCPGIAMDENGPNSGRTWQYVGGSFVLADTEDGSCMIRSTVKYGATAPVITAPTNNSFFNNEKVTVTGKAAPGLDLHLFNNDTEIAVGKPNADGSFSFEVALQEGVNILKAQTTAENGYTPYSEEVKVIVDKKAPIVDITSPEDNARMNNQVITVTGTVKDDYLDYVDVNETKAEVDSNGNWTAKLMSKEGENLIKVTAKDKVGNETVKSIKVYVKYSAAEIQNIMPNKDVILKDGETVKVEFDAEPGLNKAVFMINAPINGIANKKPDPSVNAGSFEVVMVEEKDASGNGTGHYVGYWTAPKKLTLNGAQITIRVEDSYGNSRSAVAAGKLYVNYKPKSK